MEGSEEEEEVPPRPGKQATLRGGGRNQIPNRRPAPGLGPAQVCAAALVRTRGHRASREGGRCGGSAERKPESEARKDGCQRAGSAGRGSAASATRTSGLGPSPTRTYVGRTCSADGGEAAGAWLGGAQRARAAWGC